jgi:hypothetical protein
MSYVQLARTSKSVCRVLPGTRQPALPGVTFGTIVTQQQMKTFLEHTVTTIGTEDFLFFSNKSDLIPNSLCAKFI